MAFVGYRVCRIHNYQLALNACAKTKQNEIVIRFMYKLTRTVKKGFSGYVDLLDKMGLALSGHFILCLAHVLLQNWNYS